MPRAYVDSLIRYSLISITFPIPPAIIKCDFNFSLTNLRRLISNAIPVPP